MRNISFALTTPQFIHRTKFVTRRLGWVFLKSGDRLMGCEKCQGLKTGEKLNRLGEIEVTDIRIEPLSEITQDDVLKEGFPNMAPSEFVEMFCKHMGCNPETLVHRIEFKYIENGGDQV